MLTIKNLLPYGHEEGFEIKTWALGYNPNGHDSDNRAVFGELENGETRMCTQGDVYVMNSNGKTVAVYHLSFPDKMPEAGSK